MLRTIGSTTERQGIDLLGAGSPWGQIEFAGLIAEGISHVSTPSHGGLLLSEENNVKVPEEWRRQGGWYEEDCEWSIGFTFLRDEILAGEDERSKSVILDGTVERTLKRWYPAIHHSYYGFDGVVESIKGKS